MEEHVSIGGELGCKRILQKKKILITRAIALPNEEGEVGKKERTKKKITW